MTVNAGGIIVSDPSMIWQFFQPVLFEGCHLPPVSDQELIARIRADNSGDKSNGLQAWKCGYCVEGLEPDIRGSIPPSSAKPSSNLRSQSISRLPSPKNPFISNLQPTISSLSLQRNAVQISPSESALRSSKSGRTHHAKEVIVISDSDSDTSPPSKLGKFSTLGPNSPAALSGPSSAAIEKADKSISRPKARHTLAQEEEESSYSTEDAQYHPQSISYRSSSSHQPIRSTANANKIITLTGPSRQRNEPTSVNVIESSRVGIDPIQSLSQKENERKRELYKQQTAQYEKRRRHKHKQRQQELMREKAEGKEPQVERVITHVLDLTLDTVETPIVIRDIAFRSSEPPKAINLEADTLASPVLVTRTMTEKDYQKETALDLFPQWINLRKNSRDIWDRSAQKKACVVPPQRSRRTFQARKLGDAQPHIYQFDSTDWVNRMKRGPRWIESSIGNTVCIAIARCLVCLTSFRNPRGTTSVRYSMFMYLYTTNTLLLARLWVFDCRSRHHWFLLCAILIVNCHVLIFSNSLKNDSRPTCCYNQMFCQYWNFRSWGKQRYSDLFQTLKLCFWENPLTFDSPSKNKKIFFLIHPISSKSLP